MEQPATARAGDRPTASAARPWAALGLSVVVCAILLLHGRLSALLDGMPALATWLTVLISITVQALPFLVLGVLLSALIATLVPASAFRRWLPANPYRAVPVAGLSGLVLPGCECASVPVAGSLVRRGVNQSVALTFLLAAPAINPVVLVSTAVAFPGRPQIVLARFLASLATAVIVGWIWLALKREYFRLRPDPGPGGAGSRLPVFVAAMRHDMLQAGGFLVVGAVIAATLNVFVPRSVLDALGSHALLSVLALSLLAVLLSICSEADAFVAASLTQFSPVAQLAFMVVGPVVDLKLASMQAGVFGRRFTIRFAPLTLVVAVLCAVGFGTLLT